MNKLRPQREIYAEYIDTAKRAIDLTAIYNSHGDQVDATRSVEHIEPDSLVFIEGHCSDPNTPVNPGSLAHYNSLRIEHGVHSADYNNYKNILIEDAESATYAPALSRLDFSASASKQRSLLIEKNCVILTADYVNIGSSGPNIDTILAEAREHPFVDTTLSIGRRIRKLEKGTAREFNVHKFREEGAAKLIAAQTAGIIHSYNTQDLNHTRGNRLTSYIIYGTAHARSLTYEIEKQDINLTQTKIINPQPEHNYIDASDKAFDTNFSRRVAHAAINATVSSFLPASVTQAALEATYPSLERLNDDKASLLPLIVQLIQIHDRIERGDESSVNECIQLLTTLSPNVVNDMITRQATEHDF